MQLSAFTDGGSRGNPGDAGIGGVVYHPNKEILYEFSKYIGVATNNEAEYSALLAVLEWIRDHKTGFDRVVCYLDSKLVVEQMNKKWKIKEPRMRVLAEKCWKLVSEIEKEVLFIHVAREKNKEADLLVNQALDAHQL